jgi:hypothetical protein
MDSDASKELATTAHVTAIETTADRAGETGELAFLARRPPPRCASSLTPSSAEPTTTLSSRP